MSIDEAISALEKAEVNKLKGYEYSKECLQLAQWLRELKLLRKTTAENYKKWNAMNLDEAITSATETANELKGCECGKDHLQLAKWLKELKELRGLKCGGY